MAENTFRVDAAMRELLRTGAVLAASKVCNPWVPVRYSAKTAATVCRLGVHHLADIRCREGHIEFRVTDFGRDVAARLGDVVERGAE